MEDRKTRIKNYILALMKNGNNKDLYEKYKDDFDDIKREEIFEVFSDLSREGIDQIEILKTLGKVINVFSHSLGEKDFERPKDDRFLKVLEDENKKLLEKTDNITEILRNKNIGFNKKVEEITDIFTEIQNFSSHYEKKEDILFSHLEKVSPDYEGLSIMWGLDKRAKANLAEVLELLNNPDANENQIYKKIGEVFFDILGLVNKEEKILFPEAARVLDENEWTKMYEESLEYDYAFIEKNDDKKENNETQIFKDGYFKSETGSLTFEQILLIFNNLPVDITFVDENNKVRFFSRPKDRIFKRTPAVIAREVNKCHPPQSVHIVEEIVEKFRNGEEDSAKFWIDVKGRKLLIQYFALRNEKGDYKGVLEASQDITEIQKIEGQRRIVDWK